jgi:hypothetical protein
MVRLHLAHEEEQPLIQLKVGSACRITFEQHQEATKRCIDLTEKREGVKSLELLYKRIGQITWLRSSQYV